MTFLLDANVLIALFDSENLQHANARRWFLSQKDEFATCPIVEGAFVRWLVRLKNELGVYLASEELKKIHAHPRHRFWSDDLPYAKVKWEGVMGHKQVTDAYLAALARKHRGRLATFDRGLAALHDDVAELIPT